MEYLYSTNTVRFEKNNGGKLKVIIHNVGTQPPFPKIEGTEREIDIDAAVIAIGQATNWAEIDDATGGLIKKERGKAIIDELTFETSMPGVFAGGDIVQRGKAVAIAAVAHGREAAVSIDRYLRGLNLREGRLKKDRSFFDKPLRPPRKYSIKADSMKGQSTDIYLDWNEIDGMFTAESAINEAKRCLACNNFCSHCQDYTGVLADISAGENGSDPGFTTVLAWTEKGRQLVHKALEKGLFEQGKIDMNAVDMRIVRKSTREMWSFEKPLREKVRDFVIATGPSTVSMISAAVGARPTDVSYEALRLVQERQLSMNMVENSSEPEFDIFCEE